jgi:hypothetical protein
MLVNEISLAEEDLARVTGAEFPPLGSWYEEEDHE